MSRAMSLPERPNLLDLNMAGLVDFCQSLGEKPYRGRQVAAWIFRRGALDFEEMSDISKASRLKLAAAARLYRPRAIEVAEDEEARKILWELSDGHRVESVLIREPGHLTLCLSSQAGCALGCRFCRTGTLGFVRNLTAAEIVGQVIGARDYVRPGETLSNLVFMGMGEPLLNRENVVKSLGLITDPDLLAVAKRHISISTVGIVPELPHLARGPEVGLTVSLSAPTDELRDRIMPVNKKYPLAALKQALALWPLPRGRRITLAYVLLKGVNDSLKEAAALSRFVSGLRVKFNLIPFNPWPGAPFEAPDRSAVEAFRDFLANRHYTVMVRWSKGGNLSAACGQLAAARQNPAP